MNIHPSLTYLYLDEQAQLSPINWDDFSVYGKTDPSIPYKTIWVKPPK